MPNLQAIINPPVQEVPIGSSATFSCVVNDAPRYEAAQPMSYQWEAAPYIVQEQRYTFSADKHQLEIYNVKISDNNTSVWCTVDPSDNSGPSNRAKARIVVVPGVPGRPGSASSTTKPGTTDAMLSVPMERRGGRAAGATVASLLLVLIAFAVLLVFAYRRMRRNRHGSISIGSKLLGNKSSPRRSKITRYSGGEDGYQEPVIPAFSTPSQYTCLTHTSPINKRPIPPPRTKRGKRRNTEPATLCPISEDEENGYNIIRPSSAEPGNAGNAGNEYNGYMDMSGKNSKHQNRTPRRAYSHCDTDEDSDYENIHIRTISNRNPTQLYKSQNAAGKNKGHLPSHTSGNNSNKPQGAAGGGTLVYASLDLGDISDGDVFLPPREEERTTYAKILRILSVFRTMRSTRIRVLHTGADGKHEKGHCQTTRYR